MLGIFHKPHPSSLISAGGGNVRDLPLASSLTPQASLHNCVGLIDFIDF